MYSIYYIKDMFSCFLLLLLFTRNSTAYFTTGVTNVVGRWTDRYDFRSAFILCEPDLDSFVKQTSGLGWKAV